MPLDEPSRGNDPQGPTKGKGIMHASVCRADLHVHSTASAVSKLGVQRSVSLPECATEPEEVYELAKRQGMDFVTITDHDTIAGAEQLSHLPDTFISEELTAGFKGEPQAVHVLCLGITAADHEWLQAHRGDVELCAAYLHEHEITAALAHPFYAVGAPLTARHRRRLAQLFPIWETRNGSRAKELNRPAFVYIETHGGTAVGGSDDHAGIDVGRTFTETPPAASPQEFLAHIRAGRASAHGQQGSAAKWTHAAIALAIRSLGRSERPERPDPLALMRMVERVMREGELRQGEDAADVSAADARALLRAWLDGLDLGIDGDELLHRLQDGRLSHADLERRANRVHERKLAEAVEEIVQIAGAGDVSRAADVALSAFDACVPAIPYAAATTFLGREKAKLSRAEGDRPRVAILADGIGSTHGVTRTINQIRARGVPGFEVEIVGTDAGVDRRLDSVAEVEVPFYEGLRIGVPSLPAIATALAEGHYDLVQLCSPGPAGMAGWLIARVLELPVLAGHHTELAAYTGMRTGRPELEAIAELAIGRFYASCDAILSASPASDRRLADLGLPAGKVMRWDRGVDVSSFSPARRREGLMPPDSFNVLYAGRQTREKGIDLLAEAFLQARLHDPRLHLVLAGGGPEEGWLRTRLGEHATFLGWVEHDSLPEVYASADAFLFPSSTDTFGQVVLEAQASGIPVLAVDRGGPAGLIEDGVSGLLREPDAASLAGALVALSASAELRERLVRGGREAVRERTWERSLERLAAAYLAVLPEDVGATARTAA